MSGFIRRAVTASLSAAVLIAQASFATACTGILLKAQDGGVIYGRSMEWGTFDLLSRVAIVPRGHEFTGLTPDGENGKTWTVKHGFVGLDMLEKDTFGDGMNEAGLSAGMFYHPGFAEYPAYDPARAADTITALDVLGYILSNFATIDEVKAGLPQVRVVPVVEEAIGIPIFAHWMVTEKSGRSIVIEYTGGEIRFHDNPLGVITNAPNYDWHMTNLRNYLNLSAVALPTKNIEELDFTPLGGGSGMIGLPGDNTPPSRFVRAVAATQTARATATTQETIYEAFRILDNFNLPLGAAEGSAEVEGDTAGMRSSTIWTSAWDQGQMILSFHTQHNRRVRQVRFDGLDFTGTGIVHIPMDIEKQQDVLDITPAR